MNSNPTSLAATKRIAHIRSHLAGGFEIDQLTSHIENGSGNPTACLMGLAGHAHASAMLAWFDNHDLEATRQWSYVAGRMDQLAFPRQNRAGMPAANTLRLLSPLLSNNSALIDWFAHYDGVGDAARVENHKTHDFWAYQAFVALRGEWDRLIERCERVMRDPPGASREQKRLLDHQFYLALAQRDLGKMNRVLQLLVTPASIRARRNDDSGYCADLISTIPVIYAKIAWRHGFEVRTESEFVPAQWLPMTPLALYDEHYRFLRPKS